MRLSRTITATLVSLAFVATPLVSTVTASSDDSSPRDRQTPNVLVKITLGKIEGGQRKPQRTYHILAPGSGTPARLNTANRIPIPATAMAPAEEGHPVPMTSFSYQNVGFQASIRATVLSGDQVKISADIEDAGLYNPEDLDRKPTPTAPVMTSFSQSIEAVLREGTPLTTTVVDDPKGQSIYIQLLAEIQR